MRQLIIFLLVLAGLVADAQVNSNNTLYTGRNKWTGYHNISNTPLIISDNNEDTLRIFVRGDSILFRGTTRFVFEPPLSGGGGDTTAGVDSIWIAGDTLKYRKSSTVYTVLLPIPSSTTAIAVTEGSFSGSNYTNSLLIGKTADTDFTVYSDGGSGTLLKSGLSYTFNSGTGTISTIPDKLRIIIY